jgi:hypothetical protein
VAALVAAIFAWKANGWYNDSLELKVVKPALAAVVKELEEANAKIELVRPVDEGDRIELAAALALIDLQQEEVERAWSKVRSLEETIDADTGCPIVRLSYDWGVCFSAATAADPTDITSCKTLRGDGPPQEGTSN